MDEFALIRHYFVDGGAMRDDVVLGIGDDAAVLRVPPGQELVVTTDSLVSGVHFPAGLDAEAIGYRALAANLSDLAAMGAQPAWVLLAITLPEVDAAWLKKFSRGFFRLAKQHNVALIGGNVARGPLNITITAHGLVPAGHALTRTGARPGDAVFVTGHPGDAAAGLQLIQVGRHEPGNVCVQRFCYPEPRIAAGLALRGVASAAIDISDGLLADLSHLLEADNCGATLELAGLPLSTCLRELQAVDAARRLALTGGDDYELCFTVPTDNVPALQECVKAFGCAVTRIGMIDGERGLRLRDEQGTVSSIDPAGYLHFS
ncbi:MAG TPA: thiamine-phosphate kinase [Gammaproteobacteria bacterium]